MISIVVPAYNESGNITAITEKIREQLANSTPYEILFVDDGSEDSTLSEIKEIAHVHNEIKYISFSRNFGHQIALKAGLDHARGDCVITMDADLQHPPELLLQLIDKWREGYEVVYTIRTNNEEMGIIKRLTSKCFYKIINKMSDVEITEGGADFRLLDKKVVEELRRINERCIFIRGLVPWMGFRQTAIHYNVQPRFAGESKYSIKRMISFAVQGIISFSILPLRFSAIIGCIISALSFLYALYILYARLFTDRAVTGWTSLMISLLFLSGIQLCCLGLMGEYMGKMFLETKARPLYIIREKKYDR